MRRNAKERKGNNQVEKRLIIFWNLTTKTMSNFEHVTTIDEQEEGGEKDGGAVRRKKIFVVRRSISGLDKSKGGKTKWKEISCGKVQ